MAADNSRFVAGHYTATFGGSNIGTTEVGFTIRPMYHVDPVKIDDFGDAVVDGIYRGYNLRISFQLVTWTEAGREILQFPFDSTLGTIDGVGKTIVGSFAESLVLTPVAGINSNSKTYTFPLTAPDGDHGGFNLNTRHRRVECNLLVYANGAGGTTTTAVLFTQSA